MNKESRIGFLLEKRRQDDALRELKPFSDSLVDFSSNDYLGLARSEALKVRIQEAYHEQTFKNGSTGSRLLTGNSQLTEECEVKLARFFGFEASTVFNSGYMANLAFFSSVPQRGDTVIYDEYAHACIKDGCRLSHAKRLSFKHNDLGDLEKKIKESTGEIFIACESVYSMDGDLAPIQDIIALAKSHQAKVVVDEAHSTGIFGNHGEGLIAQMGVQEGVFAVIYTFGKAMGIHGACISGSQLLKDFIINFSRPFIYTTAPSAFEITSIMQSYDFLKDNSVLIQQLKDNIAYFNQQLPDHQSPSAIKSIIIGGNGPTKKLADKLKDIGLDVRPILSPTVKTGTERLRICLHAFNTESEIDLICKQIKG
ncbi:aminotransferase class I/II-fold pyridoxal phosphate-dependent enzyme [Roseivirga misakiensis]|uniref:Aminotransferase class I/classII large domain-containing protein n=1 Tax=Roseivirga misakiensis TaxID=1563681 RepID=A0A1E5SK49_9BACT|nr:8-amino-7-oxononanoate synthase [Roseivirga misakiensis]OEJ99497.1 hypothetical protein BFP71_07905 [Roseivirga misakiensis]